MNKNNEWIILCGDTSRGPNNRDIIEELNKNIKSVENPNTRLSCLTYNKQILMHYDYSAADSELISYDDLRFLNQSMPFYDLLGELFLRILEADKKYTDIKCCIITSKLIMKNKHYNKKSISDLFDLITRKINVFTIDINIINKQRIIIKDTFDITEKIDELTEIIEENESDSSTHTSVRSNKSSGRKNIYFTVNIKN